MKKSNFGETLRREREMRGVSLEEIATATRISPRFLDALENERWDHLPGGVFNRGFVRAVARFLGLDEENLVAEYALATNDKPEVAVWAVNQKPRRRVAPFLVLALLVAMAAGAFFAWLEAGPMVGPWLAEFWDRTASSRSAAGVAASEPAPVPQAAPAPATESSASEPLVLTLETISSVKVTVIADGRTLFDDRLRAGEKKRFEAREKFEVRAGDAHAVFLELNGQVAPSLGQPGQPGSVTLTRADLKPQEGAPH
jgi:cytoskeletal protein RodZ